MPIDVDMNLHTIILVIILVLGIGIPNIFASDIASLNRTGNRSSTLTPMPSPTPSPSLTPTPTPLATPNPSIPAPLNLFESDTSDGMIVNETMPTIQQLASNNPNMSSIIVNFSAASDIDAEYDEEKQRLSIEITKREPNEQSTEETEQEEMEDAGNEEDEGDNGEDSDNGDDNDNDNGNDDGSGLQLPGLPDIDLNLPGF